MDTGVRGQVTQVISHTEIVIDFHQRIIFDRCLIFGIKIGDSIKVVIDEQNRITIETLREDSLNSMAFVSQTSSTVNPRDREIDSIRTNRWSRRSHPYTQNASSSSSAIDKPPIEWTDSVNGISIIKEINFGQMRPKTPKTIAIRIKNESKNHQILRSIAYERTQNQIELKAYHMHRNNLDAPPFMIAANSFASVELHCYVEFCGQQTQQIVFKFDGFQIERMLCLIVSDRPNSDHNTDYNRRFLRTDITIIAGQKLWQKDIFDNIGKYSIPKKLWRVIEKNQPVHFVFPELIQPFTQCDYQKRFHALLYLEETENQKIISKFDMTDVTLRQEDQDFFAIAVPQLSHVRLKLIQGDKVVVFEAHKPDIGIEGFIHEVRSDDIIVHFNRDFHQDFGGGRVRVEFEKCRMVYRRCHHAIDLINNISDQILFPTNVSLNRSAFESITYFHPTLNLQQRYAVVGALRGECSPTPFIIFGPPGTGKTVTVVESILQVFDKIADSRIIVCTASNSSADLIVKMLLETKRVTQKDMIRVTALHRLKSVPEAVQSVTQIADEDPFKWLFHPIIVTTTSQAGVVFRHWTRANHFTHVFIDEAAQVTEPESLIPICLGANGMASPTIVLAGDYQQLGPLILSTKAKSHHLDMSLMERLMSSFKVYKRDDKFKRDGFYDRKFVVKLITNYRSNQQIMTIPSQLFYQNELKFIQILDYNLLFSVELKSAVNFVGVLGKDMQDSDTYSWYNHDEIKHVYSNLSKLYGKGVDPKDIVIITPYRKQVMEIQSSFHRNSLAPCTVTTVEKMQGLESRIVIISMVRSSAKNLEHDSKYNLGFVHSAKRFNVAVSRAKSLLIVIGNPTLLSRDSNWGQFIDFCLQNKSYCGCPFRYYGNHIDWVEFND